MCTNKANKERDPRERKSARLKYKIGGNDVEIPVEISCRKDGKCMICHPRMKDLIFPKVVKGLKKGKRR